MRSSNKLEIVKAVSILSDFLLKMDIHVHESSNFSKLEKAVARLRQLGVTDQFRKEHFELYTENSHWLRFTNSEKRIVAVLAMRFEWLGERTLAEHWQDQQHRIYPQPNRIGKKHSPSAFMIKGKVVYGGDFYLEPEYRGKRIAGLMVFLGFLMSHLKWDPDWIYGLMADKKAMAGFASQVGFTIAEPRGTHWKSPPKGINPNDWLVAVDRASLRHRAKLIARSGSPEFLQPMRKT